MPTVTERIAEVKARRGTIQGKSQTRAQRGESYFRAVAAETRRMDGKPRSWKRVCQTPSAVKINGYDRVGTKDGRLAKVSVGSHCRNQPRAATK